jgi:hypothetical protein
LDPTFVLVAALLTAVVGVGLLTALLATRQQSDMLRPGGDEPEAGEQEREVREFTVARNERRVARGLPALDVEREVRRLLATGDTDAEAEELEEARALVELKNARRVRRGLPPLDLEAEIGRRLRALRDELSRR